MESQSNCSQIAPTDLQTPSTLTPRCHTCRKDRQKCIRKANQAKCQRCLEYSYTCADDEDVNDTVEGKRRKLHRLKCEICRSAKVKCEPVDRAWPEKCSRCSEKGLPCSEPQVSHKKIQTDSTPKSEESKTRSAHTPLQNSKSDNDASWQSMSDVVHEFYPPQGTYKYTPLKNDEIRLLIVHPGLPGEDLICSLVTEPLPNCQPYQALSYRWGSDPTNNLIKLLSYSFPDIPYFKMYTRSNLFEALQQLRQREEELTLYVSALCIDHDNANEKYSQSSRTQEIFHQASNVIVWLGKEAATSKKAFGFIPQVLDLTGLDRLLKDNSKTNDWIALAELMRDPLFGRRWLLQELVVAKSATLHCSGDWVIWSDFADAVLLFETNLSKIQRFFTPLWMANGGPMDDIHALSTCKLVKVVSNIIRRTPDGKTMSRLKTLESLVSTLSVFEATDPLDTIIAVKGLAKDQAQLQFIQSRIDKNEGVLGVFMSFVKYCVSSGSIDIICRHWAPENREPNPAEHIRGTAPTKLDLPSWIPTVCGSAFGAPCDNSKGRVNGDSFVGLPDHRIYNAAFGFPPFEVDLGPFTAGTFAGTMIAKGYVLDSIVELGARAAQGLIMRESLEMGGLTLGSQTVPERLWRTLVADRGDNNTCAPPWFQRVCLQCLGQSDKNGDFNTTALLNQPNCPDTSAAFLRRVQSVVWNRKFLLSKSEVNGGRLFGLAPANTRVGDVICIMYGCSVPVILREHKTQDDHYFEVIGESFVYGMMDGEAREELSDKEVETKTISFKLR